MAVGRVKRMHWWMFKTPNKGILIDLNTHIEYPFARESTGAWNIKVHDLVTFTLTDGVVSGVTLWKKYRKGFVLDGYAIT